jgi:hypothetical protein
LDLAYSGVGIAALSCNIAKESTEALASTWKVLSPTMLTVNGVFLITICNDCTTGTPSLRRVQGGVLGSSAFRTLCWFLAEESVKKAAEYEVIDPGLAAGVITAAAVIRIGVTCLTRQRQEEVQPIETV